MKNLLNGGLEAPAPTDPYGETNQSQLQKEIGSANKQQDFEDVSNNEETG